MPAEPWRVTRAEYANPEDWLQGSMLFLPAWASKEAREVFDLLPLNGRNRKLFRELKQLLRQDQAARQFEHSLAVRDALFRGEDVPAEVLRDYPLFRHIKETIVGKAKQVPAATTEEPQERHERFVEKLFDIETYKDARLVYDSDVKFSFLGVRGSKLCITFEVVVDWSRGDIHGTVRARASFSGDADATVTLASGVDINKKIAGLFCLVKKRHYEERVVKPNTVYAEAESIILGEGEEAK